jgi:hypothetical protein
MRAIHTRLALAALLAATPALAQSPRQPRQGFNISFGLGGGSAGASCSECSSDRENAPSMYLRIGGALRPSLVLAGEINGWSKTETELGVEGTVTIATVNAIAQWYPNPAAGFFVSAGLGAGSMEVEFKAPGFGTFSDNTTGLGYQVGTGYDIPMTGSFSLTPFVTFFGTAGGKVESSNEKLDGNVVQFGLGFSWR